MAAVALTFGALSLLGASLTMASIGGAAGAHRPRRSTTRSSCRRGCRRSAGRRRPARGGRADGARPARRPWPPRRPPAPRASSCSLLSPVPMVRGFGLLLVGGIALALGVRADARRGARSALRRPPRARRGAAGARWRRRSRGAGEILADNRPVRGARARGQPRRAAARSRSPSGAPGACSSWRWPSRCVGWGLDTQTKVESDITKLVPQNSARSRPPGAAEVDRRRRRDRRARVAGAASPTPRSCAGWRATRARCSSTSATARSAAAARPSCAPRSRCPTSSTTRPNLTSAQIDGVLDAVPAVLLAGRDRGRPPQRDARLRHQADAAWPPAERRARRDAPRA